METATLTMSALSSTWTNAVAHGAVLASSSPTGPEFGKASPVGLAIVLLLLIGTALLVRSMNKHLRGLPTTFHPDHPEPDQEADEGTDPGPKS